MQRLPDDYWYVIVGKGDLKDELERIDTTGRLKLLGFRTDIVDLLHASDLFVFPSLQEGLPVALMEAMAAGVNVVASKIRGNTDLVDVNLVAATDVAGWKTGILKAIDKQREENLEKIRTFSIEHVNSLMKELYGKTL